MKWLPGIKTVRAASLKLPPGYDLVTRMAQPHVIELAKSIRECGGVPGNFPWVEWGRMELVAGGDRFAALCLNGLKLRGTSPDTDGMLEVRAFEGTEEDIERLRRHENIHRRQDRDRWLREQVETEARVVAGELAVTDSGPAVEHAAASAVASVSSTAPAGEGQKPALSSEPEAPHAAWCTSVDKNHGGPCLEWPAASQQPVTVTKAAKVEARRRIAAREGTTPAAVKQAEQRDRKRKGETKTARQKHDDSAGEALTKPQLEVQHMLIDVEASVSQAVVRMRNFLPRRPDAVAQFALEERLEKLRDWLKSLELAQKGAGL